MGSCEQSKERETDVGIDTDVGFNWAFGLGLEREQEVLTVHDTEGGGTRGGLAAAEACKVISIATFATSQRGVRV